MIKVYVFMRIIGKILEGNHQFIIMIQFLAKIGNLLIIF